MSPVQFTIACIILVSLSTAVMTYIYYLKKSHRVAMKQLQKEKSIFEEALSCTDVYLWRINLESNIFWIQDEFYQMIGESSEDVAIEIDELRAIFHPDDLSKLERLLTTDVPGTGKVEETIRLKHAQGHYIWAHVSAKIVVDEWMNPMFITGAVMDVTTLIATENALRDSYKTIDHTRNMNKSFLARMSHEIRTPLNAISGYVQLLEREVKDKAFKEHIGIIKESANQLVDVMSEIIDAGQLEAGEMTLKVERIVLKDMMTYFEKAFMKEIKEKDVSYEVIYSGDDSYAVLSDELRLNQIISNLVSNALKYTAHGIVTLKLETNKYSFNRLELIFTIEDSGIGIHNDQIIDYINSENISDDFNLVMENGLGLSIVYNLVKMMKGTVHVTSKVGMGTVFEVRVKTTIAPRLHKVAQEFDSRIFFDHEIDRSKRILVAEDNEINQILLADILRMFDLTQFDLANDGQEALELYEKNDYELIITDIQMPLLSGSEVAKEIRKTDVDIPIIAMTANILEDQLSEYYAAGINDYVAKPVDVGRLKNLLDKYLM